MQRKVEPKLDRVLLELSFGIYSSPKLRSLESHIVRAGENQRGDLATRFHSAAGETQSQRRKQVAINHTAGTSQQIHAWNLGFKVAVTVLIGLRENLTATAD